MPARRTVAREKTEAIRAGRAGASRRGCTAWVQQQPDRHRSGRSGSAEDRSGRELRDDRIGRRQVLRGSYSKQGGTELARREPDVSDANRPDRGMKLGKRRPL